jgi:DNA (cytosine-5)-methyltransferase 1
LWTRADGTQQRAAKSVAQAAAAMGIDWMNWRELCEAIPPAYTEFIGEQLLAHLVVAA